MYSQCDSGRACFDSFTGCVAGKWGDDCSHVCSEYCKNLSCHLLNGTCMACIDGKTGPYCEDDGEKMLSCKNVALLFVFYNKCMVIHE